MRYVFGRNGLYELNEEDEDIRRFGFRLSVGKIKEK
jgi:hypothetical protein